MSDLASLGAAELAAAYAAGRADPVAATQAALERVEALDRHVNAFVLVDRDGALASAQESARRWAAGRQLGPADGIPTAVKDIFLTRGWPTLRGSLLIDEAGPWLEDAPAVARLREAGAVLLGKTTTPEFAWKGVTDSRRHGSTGNPWDPLLTAGGSSGGSAAAVALGMGAWSIGTDGGGSVRIPAAFTGTAALKPTYGRVPLWPASPYGTLAHAGPMTRSVGDLALLLDVLAGADPRDWSALPPADGPYGGAPDGDLRGLRVAWSPTLGLAVPDPEVAAAAETAAGVLASLGASVVPVDPDLGEGEVLREAFETLWFAGAAKVLQPFGPEALGRVDPLLAEQVRRRATTSASDYLDATAVRMELGARMGAFHQRYDVLVCPTVPVAAFERGRDAPPGWPSPLWTTWAAFTYAFNMTQQPASSQPCGFTADGRPVGLQVVGPRHADRLVLRVARAYEAATDWHTRTPPLLAR